MSARWPLSSADETRPLASHARANRYQQYDAALRFASASNLSSFTAFGIPSTLPCSASLWTILMSISAAFGSSCPQAFAAKSLQPSGIASPLASSDD